MRQTTEQKAAWYRDLQWCRGHKSHVFCTFRHRVKQVSCRVDFKQVLYFTERSPEGALIPWA